MTVVGDLPVEFRLVCFDQVDSTNDEARRLADSGAPEGTVVWARSQRQGRGRHGRVWRSDPGNLYLSVVLRPNCAPSDAAQPSFAAVLALADAIAEMLPDDGARLKFKWPNDVMIGGKKVCGILTETAISGDQSLLWAILGVGVNLVSHPTDVTTPATNLRAEGVMGFDPEFLVGAFCHRFAYWHERWKREGFPPLREAWLARAAGVGETVTVRVSDRSVSGRALAFDARCALVMETETGERRTVTAGDVCFGEGR